MWEFSSNSSTTSWKDYLFQYLLSRKKFLDLRSSASEVPFRLLGEFRNGIVSLGLDQWLHNCNLKKRKESLGGRGGVQRVSNIVEDGFVRIFCFEEHFKSEESSFFCLSLWSAPYLYFNNLSLITVNLTFGFITHILKLHFMLNDKSQLYKLNIECVSELNISL